MGTTVCDMVHLSARTPVAPTNQFENRDQGSIITKMKLECENRTVYRVNDRDAPGHHVSYGWGWGWGRARAREGRFGVNFGMINS
jgi:hypothetical protein